MSAGCAVRSSAACCNPPMSRRTHLGARSVTAEIEVSPLGSGRFRVRVRSGSGATTHEVTVPEQFRGGPDIGAPDLERLVRESFLFLLEREDASSILSRFSLDEISRYFPEYPSELARRLR
jgi:hypothetical protein